MCIITRFIYEQQRRRFCAPRSQHIFTNFENFSRSLIEKARWIYEGWRCNRKSSLKPFSWITAQVDDDRAENSRDLILFTFPISLSSLGEGFFDFFARDFFSVAGNLRRDQQAAPWREKANKFFSIHNADCLIELDPIRSPKNHQPATREKL